MKQDTIFTPHQNMTLTKKVLSAKTINLQLQLTDKLFTPDAIETEKHQEIN